MKHPLKWEFPGGKKEEDENLLECLHREILEELGVEIKILEKLPSNTHQYSHDKVIELIPFRCSLQTFEIDLEEHLKIEWASKSQLQQFDWTEADIPIVEYYTRTSV
jgi:8-oxo-dGTP diphosphatase